MNLINQIQNIKHTDSGNFFLLAGPCVVESEENVMQVAEYLNKLSGELKIPYVFKASYRKANRSRIDSFTGIGDEKALKLLRKVREELKVPVVTDVHSPEDFFWDWGGENISALFKKHKENYSYSKRQSEKIQIILFKTVKRESSHHKRV